MASLNDTFAAVPAPSSDAVAADECARGGGAPMPSPPPSGVCVLAGRSPRRLGMYVYVYVYVYMYVYMGGRRVQTGMSHVWQGGGGWRAGCVSVSVSVYVLMLTGARRRCRGRGGCSGGWRAGSEGDHGGKRGSCRPVVVYRRGVSTGMGGRRLHEHS